MAIGAPIRIEVQDAAEGIDLSDTLAVRGLCGELVANGRRWEVEVRCGREEAKRLLRDVAVALETWLADRRLDSIGLHSGERRYTVRRHLGLSEVTAGARAGARNVVGAGRAPEA